MSSRPDMTISQRLAVFFRPMKLDVVPGPVAAMAKLLILDTIGVSVAGASEDWGRQIVAATLNLGGTGKSSVFCGKERIPAENAALANGCLAQALDFDDTYLPAILHPSCCVVPTALAVGEANGSTGGEVLAAAICGYEVMLRLVSAGRNNFFKRNYHTLGLLGPIGASVVAARLSRGGRETMVNAIGIAASQGGGILQALREGQHVKALRAGYACHAGILSANLAAMGVEGPKAALEGELGLYRTFLSDGEFDLDVLSDGLGDSWYTPDISIKLFPGGHRSHYFIQAALEARQTFGLNPEDIETVTCISSPKTEYYNFSPAGYAPPTSYMARFSVPFVVASALRAGHVDLASFEQHSIVDPETLSLAHRVRHSIEDDADQPGKRGGLIIAMRDGRILRHTPAALAGTPERPATREQVLSKFRRNVSGAMSMEAGEEVHAMVMGLENLDSLSTLSARLR